MESVVLVQTSSPQLINEYPYGETKHLYPLISSQAGDKYSNLDSDATDEGSAYP